MMRRGREDGAPADGWGRASAAGCRWAVVAGQRGLRGSGSGAGVVGANTGCCYCLLGRDPSRECWGAGAEQARRWATGAWGRGTPSWARSKRQAESRKGREKEKKRLFFY
jgi:hypothetical protein